MLSSGCGAERNRVRTGVDARVPLAFRRIAVDPQAAGIVEEDSLLTRIGKKHDLDEVVERREFGAQEDTRPPERWTVARREFDAYRAVQAAQPVDPLIHRKRVHVVTPGSRCRRALRGVPAIW